MNNNDTLRQMQLSELKMLKEAIAFFEENDITYYAIGGTLLGAVRHKGFIPWDDDIDVIVPREDWNRFIEAMKKDLDDKYYFQCFETDKLFNVINGPTMKVRKKGTWIEEVNKLLKNRCKSGDGIFVDVIIYDNISESKLKFELNYTFLKIMI